MSVVVKKTLADTTRARIENWLLSAAGTIAGIGRVAYRSDPANYKYVSALGNWTPSQLPGATIVTAAEVLALQQNGVPIVDVRIAKEYQEQHIRRPRPTPSPAQG